MRASVAFRLPSGGIATLGHGDIIGRLVTAQLVLDDPRVSEAHALVSVRRGELVLLSLRRMFAVRGRAVAEVVLQPGMTIELAHGLELLVTEVARPGSTLAVELDGLGRHTLPSVATLHAGPPPILTSRFDPDGVLHLWWSGDGWRARGREGEARVVAPGDELRVGAMLVRFVEIALQNVNTTPGGAGAIEAPLRIVAHYDTVEIHRDGRPPLTLGGVSARIMSELVVLAGPVEWQVVAREVWGDAGTAQELRHRWDVTLARLRARLKESGIRGDLVHPDGSGHVQLVRYPADVIEDRT